MAELTLQVCVMMLLLAISYKCKHSRVLLFFICIMTFIMIAFSFDSADLENYRRAYDFDIYMGKDPLYFIFQELIHSTGAKFEFFKMLIGTIMTVLFLSSIFRYTEHRELLLSLCLFIPVSNSFATQIRSGLAGCIIILALTYLFANNMKSKIIYLVLVVMASFIHQMSLFYIILIIPVILKDTKRFIYFTRVCIFIVTIFMINAGSIITDFADFISSQSWTNSYLSILVFRMKQMFTGEFKSTLLGFAFNALFHSILYYCAEVSLIQQSKIMRLELPYKEWSKIDLIRGVNCLLLAFIPLYAISFHFVRAFYYAVPFLCASTFNSIYAVRKVRRLNSYGQIRVLLVIGVIIFVYFWGILQEPADTFRLVKSYFEVR